MAAICIGTTNVKIGPVRSPLPLTPPGTKAHHADVLQALAGDAAASTATPASAPSMTTTAINLPTSTLHLLRRVAVERANRRGGRPSVSRVIVELVEAHQAEL